MAIDIRKPVKKYLPHLLKARDENLNEADTVQRVIRFIEEVLGYDPMEDITRESSVKDRFCDIALKVDGTIRILVEVKSADTVLRDRHTEQAQNYASHANIRWVVLTNGLMWNLYHLTFDEGIEAVQAFSVDLSEGLDEKDAELLALLHHHSVRKDALDEYWNHRAALSPASLGKAIFTEEVLKFIRREVRRREGLLIDQEDLANAIRDMLSTETREQLGPMKIRRRSRGRSKPVAEVVPEEVKASAVPTRTQPESKPSPS